MVSNTEKSSWQSVLSTGVFVMRCSPLNQGQHSISLARFAREQQLSLRAMDGQDDMSTGERNEPSEAKSDISQHSKVHSEMPAPGVSVERREHMEKTKGRVIHRQQTEPAPQSPHSIPHGETRANKLNCNTQLEPECSSDLDGMSGKSIDSCISLLATIG